MLRKLLKHEFKATARSFCAMYILVFVITVVLKVLMEVQDKFNINSNILSMITGITIFGFVLGIIAVILGTYVLIIKRFYDSMLKDEGYLSFTLPVTTGQHIASKSIVSYIWVILSGAFICLTLGILVLGNNYFIIEMRNGIEFIIEEISNNQLWGYLIEILLMMALSVYVYISMGYACFSIGQTFGKNKILGAFVSYIAIYFIMQVVSSIAMVIIFGTNMNYVDNVGMGDKLFHSLMTFSFVFGVIEAVAFTVITHIMLNKRLNLE